MMQFYGLSCKPENIVIPILCYTLRSYQFIISDTEGNLQKAVYLLYSVSKEYNLEIATKKTKVFGFVGADHLRTKIIINDETLEQVSQFTYLGCSISYQFSSDVEPKVAIFLQLVGTIKRTIFRK